MKNLLLALSIVLIAPNLSIAQKIAHADVNAILSVMPENKKVNEDLQIYATGLQKGLDDIKGQLDGLGKEFQRVLAAGDTAKALEIQKQAIEGDKQAKQATAQAEQKLGQKRNELLQPVLTRLNTAMQAVAKKAGYEYVVNSVDGSGTSIMLMSPEGSDITMGVVKELGIELKQDGTPVQDGKKKKK